MSQNPAARREILAKVPDNDTNSLFTLFHLFFYDFLFLRKIPFLVKMISSSHVAKHMLKLV